MHLNENLLIRIAEYSAANSHYLRDGKAICERFDKVWFDKLKVSQPELLPEIELFTNGVTTTNPHIIDAKHSFVSIFKDKIKANNIMDNICQFGTISCKLNTSEKTKLLTDIYTFDTNFLKDYHTYLLENLQNYHITADNFIAYMSLVKNDKGQLNLPKEEVMTIVNHFKPQKTEQIKRLSSFVTSYLGKTQEAADSIYNTVKSSLEFDSVIKKLWEEKISAFPKEIQANFKKASSFNPFTSKESYFLSYRFDPNWIVDEFSYSMSKANNAVQRLYFIAEDLLKPRVDKGTDIFTKNCAVLEIHCQSIEQRDLCSKIVNIMFDSLPSELPKYEKSGIDYTNTDSITANLNKSIDSYMMAEELHNSLNNKTSSRPKGMKI